MAAQNTSLPADPLPTAVKNATSVATSVVASASATTLQHDQRGVFLPLGAFIGIMASFGIIFFAFIVVSVLLYRANKRPKRKRPVSPPQLCVPHSPLSFSDRASPPATATSSAPFDVGYDFPTLRTSDVPAFLAGSRDGVSRLSQHTTLESLFEALEASMNPQMPNRNSTRGFVDHPVDGIECRTINEDGESCRTAPPPYTGPTVL
ncbi:hypothetical protein BC834DRAFT_966002 [Gloeopeniophorella convolvens]|nr:hypothetical protein BC834DRAFT_966002 [Gloeopeniophorella convolvens]